MLLPRRKVHLTATCLIPVKDWERCVARTVQVNKEESKSNEEWQEKTARVQNVVGAFCSLLSDIRGIRHLLAPNIDEYLANVKPVSTRGPFLQGGNHTNNPIHLP